MFNFIRKLSIAVIAIMLITLSIFSWSLFKKSSQIQISGSTTLFPMAQACAEYYMKNVGRKTKITVAGGGSSVGIAALIDGQVDIADASRPMKDKEKDKAKSKDVNPVEFLIAYDGITIVTNTNITLTDLTSAQVKDIFTGKIKNWSEVGGPDAEMIVVSRDTSSGTYGDFKDMALEKEEVVSTAQFLASNQAIATTVSNTPNAIGYIAYGYLKSAKLNALKIDGIMPSPETVKDDSYVWARAVYMYTNGQPKGDVKKFIDFCLSKKGQQVGEEAGLISKM